MAHRLPNGKAPADEPNQAEAGFTLLELLVVLFIIGLLASVAVPAVQASLTRAREAALLENLNVMRRSIDAYYSDKGEYPSSLETLVDERYLKFLPDDPVGENEQSSWGAETDTETSGIIDVHSKSEQKGTDGRPYSQW